VFDQSRELVGVTPANLPPSLALKSTALKLTTSAQQVVEELVGSCHLSLPHHLLNVEEAVPYERL
jgi:hypothetical protein